MIEQAWTVEQDMGASAYAQNPLVRQVAQNLRNNLGSRAVDMAHQAIERMRANSDAVGLSLWLAIHARMVEEEQATLPAGIAVH
ncbi:hypothetical protein [Pedomonas mirosovicensis]|uniref:hypothetical protein n=1 Tax=Pedomonas mirosovicensis TaxID=2908641 RepID=UPI00216A7C07|nr:hypothetical protein [Pedomonas mirosovicensis]MCH8683753.1 hypothetical protein [Pedomonas mirosovicensis]